MISLLQQTAPVVVDEQNEIIVTPPETVGVAEHAGDAPLAETGAVIHAPVGTTDVTHAGTHGVVTDVAHETATGLPQLDVATFPNQIFWLVITLLVIYFILSRIALPRIAAVLSDRQGAISGDLMAAEEFKRKAQDAEAAYDKALADARAEAQKIVAANRAEIQGELDRAIAHADAEISARTAESEKRIGEIRASAEADAQTVARDVTAELLSAFGGAADQGAIDAAVDRRLKGAVQ